MKLHPVLGKVPIFGVVPAEKLRSDLLRSLVEPIASDVGRKSGCGSTAAWGRAFRRLGTGVECMLGFDRTRCTGNLLRWVFHRVHELGSAFVVGRWR